MKKLLSVLTFISVTMLIWECYSNKQNNNLPVNVKMTKDRLSDKIKGGWAGQTIGCTYGGPTEFLFCGTIIHDSIPILWPDGHVKWYYDNFPGLYDDVYMDLTFVKVFDSLGLDAPVEVFANAYAHAGYDLWHANQAGRYNILNGIMPPQSGHWINNPHADDIDFQIEADFAGLMSPGMPNSASEITDKIGHIMNYGDGWYGGVYVAAMYSLAFVSDDINFIVKEALKTIPQQSRYYRCMGDVIKWHEMYPDDWKRTWLECEKKWSFEVGCPDGVFTPFNIDAVINSAYILIGLLYGEGDFAKTIDIATRCGQDSDCNPASAGGILGTILGYDKIPEYWKKNLRDVEDRNFAYTDLSLNETYDMSFDQALQMIERGGGKVKRDQVVIACQNPVPVRFEQSFEGHIPVERRELVNLSLSDNPQINFEGTGVVVSYQQDVASASKDYVAKVEIYMDGELSETVELPTDFKKRRCELYWKYQLPKGKHTLSFKWLNPGKDINLRLTKMVIYSDTLSVTEHE